MTMSKKTSIMPAEILNFWFEDIDSKNWWKKDSEFDQFITDKYGDLHQRAARCELYGWRRSIQGRLAEILVLDQFSRNIHRGSPLAFSADPLALALAQEAVARSLDKELDDEHRVFLYMPYMHSESQKIHEQAVLLFQTLGEHSSLEFELKHKAIIDRFGRYPHRNVILGRSSTEEEVAFLKEPGSSF
ncbi:hypothetical protein TDB9533_00389 [Thalassocella blandensis]|nr:hypothetical protein TDB9533_00389 [Thalassocella blandensis]